MNKLPMTATVALCACLGLAGVPADAAPPPEFTATYRIEKGSLSGRMIMTLRRDGRLWRLESRSEPSGILSMFDRAYITESSVLEERAEGLRPIAYRYTGGKKPSKRDVSSYFDWNDGELKSTRGADALTVDLHSGTFDNLSVILEVAAKLRSGPMDVEIPIAAKGEIRASRFVREDEETVEVEAGSFKALRVQEFRGERKRTVSWFAPGQHYLPVRIDRYRNGEREGGMELIAVEWLPAQHN